MPNWRVDAWVEAYEEAHGFKPGVTAKDVGILAAMGKTWPDDDWFRWAVRAYHTRTWDWEGPERSGYSTGLFRHCAERLWFEWNTYRLERAKRQAAERAADVEAGAAQVVNLVDRLVR